MATIPEADFTPNEVNLRLKQNNYTPVSFTFSDTDFTGYTSPVLKWAENKADTPTSISMTVTDAPLGKLEVIFDDAEWNAIGDTTSGFFQLEILDASSNTVILASGDFGVEWSL